MPENPLPRSRSILFLAVPILFLIGWYCLDVIEESRERAIRVQHIDSLRNILPLMRERLTPQSLAQEKMLAGLFRARDLDGKTASIIVARWRRAFGRNIKYAIWNKDSVLQASYGFTPKDLDAILSISNARRGLEPGEPVFRDKPMSFWPAVEHLFSKTVNPLGRNPISLSTSKFIGRTGQLLMGPWFPDMVFDCEATKDLGRASATLSVAPSPCAGIIALFVPNREIRTSRWLKKALDLPASDIGAPRIHLLSGRRMLSGNAGVPGLSAGLARRIAIESESLSEGTLLDEGMTGVAFVKKAGWPAAVALHVREMDRPFRLARSPLIAVPLALLAAVILLAARFEGGGQVAAGLLRQCMLICAIVSVIPVSGLIWTGLIGSQSRSDSRRSDVMQRLVQRLEQVEAGHASYMSTLVKPVRKFIEDPGWRRGLLPPDVIASALPRLGASYMQALYVFENNGASHHLPTGPFDAADKSKEQVRILITSLLQFVQSTILSDGSSEGDQRQNLHLDLKGGMVYDTMAMAIGPENIYQQSVTFDRLVPFQLFHETTSVIFHQVLDETLRSTMFLFAVMNRKLLCQKEIAEIINGHTRSATAPPPLVLAQDSEQEWPLTYPLSQTMDPAMYLLLRRVKEEGGNIQTRISLRGTPCHVVARPLAGMDMIGAAVEPVDRENGLSVPAGLFAAAYPLMIVTLALILFRSFFLSPVAEMRKTVEAIAAGDYERRLPVLTDDEIGSLCLSFNAMARDLAEKEFLRRFISDLTMQAVAGRHRQTATRLSATVMFTDIRGFTTMSESQPPEKITAMLNEYLTRMEAVIEAHGGTIDKFIGDAIMAVFLPTHGMAPSGERAIRAAFGMRRELAVFNAARRAAGEFEIAIGSGIATGEILMGVLGRSDGRQDFTVTGPTVNISASMEKRSKETRRTPIVACPITVEAASEHIEAELLSGAYGKPVGFEVVSIADSEVSLNHSDT